MAPVRPRWLLGLRLAVLGLPIALSMVGGAELAKPAFLGGVAFCALLSVRRHPSDYVAFVLELFILTPGLRHFVDWYAGYSQTNPMMLAPYMAILAAAPAAVLYLLNRRRYAGLCTVMLVIVGLGVWMTLLTGQIQEPLLTALRWVCPILLALYIWTNAATLTEIRASVVRTARVLLPLVAAYGLVQFVSILPWDAYYMRMAPINSIGWPEPFQVRVFATMNHSGSLAAFLATGILLLLPSLRGLEFISILLACCTLFVTTQRAALGALTLTMLVLALVSRSQRIWASLLKLCLIVAVAVAGALAVPGVAAKLGSTAASVTQLGEDGSAQERLAQYALLASRIEERPFGWGLAWSGNTIQQKGGVGAPLDSGLIDILVSFGIVGGLLFLAMLGLLLVQGWTIASQVPEPAAKAEFGIIVYGLSQLPFGVQHAGEHGMFLYLGVGLLLARACAPAVSAAAQGIAGGLRQGSPPRRWAGVGGMANP